MCAILCWRSLREYKTLSLSHIFLQGPNASRVYTRDAVCVPENRSAIHTSRNVRVLIEFFAVRAYCCVSEKKKDK